MPKISEFIVGLLVISAIISIIVIFMAQLSSHYNISYNESEVAAYDSLQNLSDLAKELEEQSDLEGEAGILDIIGDYFKKGYTSVKISAKSINTFDKITEEAVKDTNLGESAQILKTLVISAVLIMLIVGVFFAAILKWAI